MALSPKEEYLEKCRKELYDYCREHKGNCAGCIFYRKVTIFDYPLNICKIINTPDIFGSRLRDSDDESED